MATFEPTTDPHAFMPPSGRPWLLLAVLSLALTSFPPVLAAQNVPDSRSIGTHFVVPIPDTVENKNGGTQLTLPPHIDLVLFAPTDAEVKLAGPTGIVRNVSVTGGSSEVVSAYDLYPPPVPIPLDPPGYIDPRTIEVTADSPIWILVRVVTPFGSETFRPLPVESWGMSYRLASLRDWFIQSIGVDPNSMEEGFEVLYVNPYAIIVAAEDGTEITLDPETPTTGPLQFSLDAGEAYSIPIRRRTNVGDTAARDLSGILVTANRPIGVISGNTRSPGAAPIEDLTVLGGNTLHNLLAEWIPPTSATGTRFLYRPINDRVDGAPEIVRIIPTGTVVTTVQTSDGRSRTVDPGSYVEFVLPGREEGVDRTPILFETDQPALAFLVTGARGIYTPNLEGGRDYGWLESWAPGMTLLEPVSEWGNIAFVRGFDSPATVDQSAEFVAEAGTLLSVDGRPVELLPVPGIPFVTGRATLSAGDHTIRSIGGRFSTVAYGIRSGSEAFLVPRAGGGGDGKETMPAHVTEYREYMSVAWASPIPSGIVEVESDSITISREEFCDSLLYTIRRYSDQPEQSGPLDLQVVDSLNGRITLDTLRAAPGGAVIGYRLTILPRNREASVSGRFVVRGVGLERMVDYLYTPESLQLPDLVDFGNGITPGTTQRLGQSLRNVRPFPVTILELQVLTVPGAFGVEVDPRLPRTLSEGESLEFDVVFSGNIRAHTYGDTLLVRTDCGLYRIPLRAETSDEEVEVPLPTITGYDWRARVIGSVNDTLSFIANSGGASYQIAAVLIVDESTSPFSLVAPSHASEVVSGADTVRVGIRFSPVTPGTWVDTILLVTTDGDSVRALLRGLSIDTSARFDFEVDPVDLDTICIGDTLLVRLTLRNRGPDEVPIAEVVPIRTTNADYVDVLYPDGATIPAAGEVTILVRIVAAAPGPIELLLGITPEGASEGEVVQITGIAELCDPPDLVVTDHDFGEIWITTTRPGSVWVKNVGRGDVTVSDATIVGDVEGSFSRVAPPVPFVVPEGDSIEVSLRFTPATTGGKSGQVLFTTTVGDRVSELSGRGKKLVVPAFIRRDYRAAPGTEVYIDVEIEEPTDTVFPDRLEYRVEFSDELLDALGVVDSTGVDVPVIGFGEISGLRHLDPTDSLSGGVIVTLHFLVRLSLLKQTELPFRIESPLPWLEFDERPGLFVREDICALENRLFDFTRFGVDIGLPEPNPSSVEATFEFEIPFDGLTTIVVYDLLGNEVLRPLDAYIVAGHYSIVIPSGSLAVGTYMLRFRSGTVEATRRIDVVR